LKETEETQTVLVQVITGTTRQGRFSERVAAWVVDRLGQRDDMSVELVDLRDHPLPFFDGVAPARTGREYARDDVRRFGQVIDRADGYIVLTAEYNHGYPAVLKNAMDWTFVEWRRKPITFVGWGNVGGARAIEQLRQVAVEYEMAPLRFAVHVLPEIMIAARQPDAPPDAELFAPLDPRLTLLTDDLEWWTATLAAGRAATSTA
jgi:NAD(P)H-dependent FMN reductase